MCLLYVNLFVVLFMSSGIACVLQKSVDVSVGFVNRLAELSLCLLFHSVCVCNFTCRPDETYALVGTAKDLTLNPRSCAGGFIHTYKIAELIDGGYKLEFVHKVSTRFKILSSAT